MAKSLGDSQRIHLASQTFPRLKRRLKIMTGNFNSQRIGDHLARAVLILHPGGMRQGHPYWMPVHQELDITAIAVPRGNGHNNGLVNTVNPFLVPTANGGESLTHATENLY